MTVAYDVKRLADGHRFGLRNFGVTIYARELAERFSTDLGKDLDLVAYAGDEETELASLKDAVQRVEREMGRSVTRTWRPTRIPAARGMLRMLGRVPRGRSLVHPIQEKLE